MCVRVQRVIRARESWRSRPRRTNRPGTPFAILLRTTPEPRRHHVCKKPLPPLPPVGLLHGRIPVEEGFEDTFTRFGGCGDATLFAADEADTGTATLVVTPSSTDCSDGIGAEAALTLEDMVFTSEDGGNPVSMPFLEMTANIGWLPG